jgi:hypothetical protein
MGYRAKRATAAAKVFNTSLSTCVFTRPHPDGGDKDLVTSFGQRKGVFATEDGTIAGWSPTVDATNAILMVDNSAPGAIYKGITLREMVRPIFFTLPIFMTAGSMFSTVLSIRSFFKQIRFPIRVSLTGLHPSGFRISMATSM